MEAEINPEGLGQRIWELREKRGWSQRRMSKEAGISQVTASKIETNQVTPRTPTLRKLARAFGVSTAELLGMEEEHSPLGQPPLFTAEAGTTEELLEFLKRMDEVYAPGAAELDWTRYGYERVGASILLAANRTARDLVLADDSGRAVEVLDLAHRVVGHLRSRAEEAPDEAMTTVAVGSAPGQVISIMGGFNRQSREGRESA